jgi:hypothetical protein
VAKNLIFVQLYKNQIGFINLLKLMAKIRNKPFEAWLYEEVEQAFGLTRLYTHTLWVAFETLQLSNKHLHYESLGVLQKKLFKYVDSWNEDELKFMFISPLINLVDYDNEKYKVFTQRPMAVKYDNDTKTTSGKVEFMLAKGKQIPQKPFFFLHEYKQENRRDNDPLGQLLIAMMAAQVQNADGETLYGCYVSGRNWFFVVLQGKEYAVSRAYDATSSAIYQLFAILLWFKEKANEKFGV